MKSTKWWESYGYDDNPFSIDPSDFIIGVDEQKEKVAKLIDERNIFALYGITGSGKTTLSKNIMKELSDRYRFIYINCDSLSGKDVNEGFDNHLKKSKKFFDFISRKPIVAILDEFHSAPENFIRQVKASWEEKEIHSVLGIRIDKDLANCPEPFRDRVGNKFVEMKLLSKQENIEMIKKRLESGKKVFDDEALNSIIEKSKNIPRRILENCSMIASELDKKDGNVIRLNETLKFKLEKSETVSKAKKEYLKVSGTTQKMLIDSLKLSEKTVTELVKEIGKNKGTVAKELSRLIIKGYAQKTRNGKNVIYSLKPDVLRKLTRD